MRRWADPATVAIDPAVPYYMVDASGLATGAVKSGVHVQMERELGSKVLRVYGSIAVKAKPDVEEVAIHDPAEYAAVALKGMLEARGDCGERGGAGEAPESERCGWVYDGTESAGS